MAEIISESKKEFQALIKKEGIDESLGEVDLKLDERYFLEERQVSETVHAARVGKSDEDKKCFGGVILTDETGVIICKNTIDARIELAYQMLLPSIRRSLFP